MNKTIIADNCSLILLSKCTLIEDVANLFKILVPQGVIDEIITRETIERFADAKIISSLARTNKIKVVKVKIIGKTFPITMDRGEIETLVSSKN